KFHAAGIAKAPEWHRSKEGIEWHKQHAKNNNWGVFDLPEKECEKCNKEYKPKTSHSKFCSNKCKSAWRRESGVDDVKKKCPVCGIEFTRNKYRRSEACSISCGRKL